MCNQAIEIQKDYAKNPSLGDLVFGDEFSEPLWVLGLDEYYNDDTWKLKLEDNHYEDSRNVIWIPHQDQLQRMIDKPFNFKPHLILHIYEFWSNQNDKEIFYDSMEQLWLAFVMLEKYNKIWNGKDWEEK